MTGDVLSDLEKIAAAQTKTLEALTSLKSSEITLDALEEIERRELEIVSEIDKLIESKR
jgi:hypothetical protein